MARKIDLDRATRAVRELLEAIGAPADDPELVGTDRRVAEMLALDLLRGYDEDPAVILGEASTATDAPGLVVVTHIAVTTTCPHHLTPAIGVAHVGYLPEGRVVGLGAIARLVDCYARRLSLQEDLGRNVASALVDVLGARGAGCVLDLSPTCLTARGDRRHGARAITHAWAGEMERDGARRAEMLGSLRV